MLHALAETAHLAGRAAFAVAANQRERTAGAQDGITASLGAAVAASRATRRKAGTARGERCIGHTDDGKESAGNHVTRDTERLSSRQWARENS